jgi:hypothetical protein
MALRNQPYLPLYVQDFMTDEKLMECSAIATGVYIKIMCVMHKSESYGTILLKQKDKQSDKQIENFAYKLAKFLPWDLQTVLKGLDELLHENVLSIDGDLLIQKRMVKDGNISDKRSLSGSKGGKKTTDKNKKFAQAKTQANSESEYESENVDEIKNENEFKKPKAAKTDLQFLIDRFNEKCDKLPKVRSLTDTRKTALKNRIEEHGVEQIEVVFEMVSESKFLNGENGSGFTASIDWVLKPQNFIKILEGNYKNKSNVNNNQRPNGSQRTDAELKQASHNAVTKLFGVQE